MLELKLFTGKTCGVCTSVTPKIENLIRDKFPQVGLMKYPVEENPELSARHSVFTVPVLLLMADGKEHRRFAGAFSLTEVESELNRLSRLLKD